MALEYGTQGQQGQTYGNEGKATTWVEGQTAKAPSMLWLGLAVGSMAISAGLMLAGQKKVANFIGQWAPSLLIIGVYNKIAKEFGAPQRASAMSH